MTPDLLNLARAVTALPGWRWMPGMQTSVEDRIVDATQCVDGRWILDTNEGTVTNARAGHEGWRRTWYDQAQEVEKNFAADAPLPDLTDAATGGCMLAMLGDVAVEQIDGKVCIIWPPDGRAADRNVTLAEACARVALARGGWRT